VDNFRALIGVQRNLGFFTTGYNYLTQILPVLVVAPLYVRGEVEFGTVTQSAMAFSQVLGAFSLVVRQFNDLSAYAAVVGRLGALWQATEPGAAPAAPQAPAVQKVPDARRLAFEGLTLETPPPAAPSGQANGEPAGGRVLVRDLSLEVPEGKRLIITGPGSSGKTALFLATAGLWGAGRGRVVCPECPAIMFLSQRPYAKPGTLRDLLRYGLAREDVPDEELHAALAEVGLDGLARQSGGLDAVRDWSRVLTEGQRWALAFARVLLARPRFAFIDGPAGALDAADLERLYAALARTPVTYISVGDHPALDRFHDLRLHLDGAGGWRLEPAGQPAPST
jgi:putative ATP-binding cassette transporter